MEDVESGNKLWKEETSRQQELLAQNHKWEMERREREKGLLVEYAALCSRRQKENANKFRKQLDKQCVSR